MLAAPEARVLQAVVQLGWLRCRCSSAYPSGLAEETGFGGNTVLNLKFRVIEIGDLQKERKCAC